MTRRIWFDREFRPGIPSEALPFFVAEHDDHHLAAITALRRAMTVGVPAT